MNGKEVKEVSVFRFGSILGVEILAFMWVIELIPAILLQFIDGGEKGDIFNMIFPIVQILIIPLAVFIAIKERKRYFSVNNNEIFKLSIITIISTIILMLVIYVTEIFTVLIPFNNLLGLAIIAVVTSISILAIFRKMFN